MSSFILCRPLRRGVSCSLFFYRSRCCSNLTSTTASYGTFSESMMKQSHVSSSLASHLISTQARGRNLVFSPLSIHILLSLLAAGSSGPTRDQLLAYFKADSVEELNNIFSRQVTSQVLTDGSPRLSFANGVWIDRSLTFNPDFKRIVEKDYKSASKRVDFQNKADKVTKQVNTWVTKKTNGLIKDILPPGSVDDRTRLIFANAIYFKGIWSKKFDSSLTKDHEFYLMNGTSVQVPFMTSKKKQCIRACDGFKVLSLPYQQGEDKRRRFSMHIFLPDDKDGLPSLVEKFGSGVDFVEQHLPRELVKVGEFLVPKFKMNFGFEATELLKGRGLDLIFEGGGFTKMFDEDLRGFHKWLFTEEGGSKVFQNSFIEVNEVGTVAAAATAMMGCGSPRPIECETFDFVADHPFLFLVREDETGVLIFVGQVTNPLLAA